jgi:tRNA (guanine-N7-)-methyltransferase
MKNLPEETQIRTVRSFVRRRGRITKRQRLAYHRLYEKCGIAFAPKLLPFSEIFSRTAPLVLEIGFGMGVVTAEIAAKHPHHDFLAIDIHPAGIGNLVALIEEKDLSNIRIIERDGIEVLEYNIPDSALWAIHIYFPDPWPKKRHHKRRLIRPDTAKLFCQKLQSGGYIHAVTDWQDYAEQILAVFEAEKNLPNTAAGIANKPDWRPLTKFEQKAQKEGRKSYDILFRRI